MDKHDAYNWEIMIRRWTTIAALLLLYSGSLKAQTSDNMVYNPSFEDYRSCPQKIEALGVMTDVEAWWQPTKGSSDYFNACGSRDCAVPRNKMGYQTAHNGQAYCGIYCSQANYREYLQTELKQPLEAGHRYHVSFWVSLADKSPHAIATLGALFTREMIDDTTSWDILMERETMENEGNELVSIATYLMPQILNPTDSTLADSKIWREVSGEFTAEGGERFLTIGNFADFNHSIVTTIESPNAILQGAYYYIDDVSVIPLDQTISSEPLAKEPAPKADEIQILHGIYFAVGKSDILPQSYNELQHLLETLHAHPEMRIELRGHTDNQGTADFNMKLSEARAVAVAEYLTKKGIEQHRITTKGFGKTMPIESNDTPEGRKHNRRVEYRVLAD